MKLVSSNRDKIQYYEVECNNMYCLDEADNSRLWGFASYPDKLLYDYEINITLDSGNYDLITYHMDEDGKAGFTRIYKTGIEKRKSICLNRFFPFTEDAAFYERTIQRVLNMKAFL